MNENAYAKRLARHYFRMLAEASGVPWDSDNDGEIDGLVDAIIDAAVAKVDRVNVEYGM